MQCAYLRANIKSPFKHSRQFITILRLILPICVCALTEQLRNQTSGQIAFNFLINQRFVSQFSFSIWIIARYYTIKKYWSEYSSEFSGDRFQVNRNYLSHCVKYVPIRSFSGPYFPEYREIWTYLFVFSPNAGKWES